MLRTLISWSLWDHSEDGLAFEYEPQLWASSTDVI